MLPMVLAAALSTALALASDPPADPVAAPPLPPGAAPGARIFSYAELKAMDAKARGPSPKRAESGPDTTHDAIVHPHRRKRSLVQHAPVRAAQVPASPKLRPAFAVKDGAKITR